eukprot:SAG31_NODE_5910_length_2260_cov_2.581212_2_plen_114_part_00
MSRHHAVGNSKTTTRKSASHWLLERRMDRSRCNWRVDYHRLKGFWQGQRICLSISYAGETLTIVCPFVKFAQACHIARRGAALPTVAGRLCWVQNATRAAGIAVPSAIRSIRV